MNEDTARAYKAYSDMIKGYNEVLEHLEYLSNNKIMAGYKFNGKINKMITEINKYKEYYTEKINEINNKENKDKEKKEHVLKAFEDYCVAHYSQCKQCQYYTPGMIDGRYKNSECKVFFTMDYLRDNPEYMLEKEEEM